jgi:hypothetical protein
MPTSGTVVLVAMMFEIRLFVMIGSSVRYLLLLLALRILMIVLTIAEIVT